MANPVGRPSKYNDEMQATAERYIIEYQAYGDVVPSLAGLSCFCGISRDTASEWVKQHPKFSDTVKAVMVMQERMLINGGLSKANDSSITKLLLASNHGYSDKQQIEQTNNDSNTIKTLRVEFVSNEV
jgi:hypothetical protein